MIIIYIRSEKSTIFCSIECPQFCLANVDQVPDRINWKKVDIDMVYDFQMQLENHNSLTAVINSEFKDSQSIDASYQTIAKTLKDVAERCFLKPHLNGTQNHIGIMS